MRTLFLNPPSYAGFDGGAGARYQAKREIRSYWYPTWLAQPAALVPESLLVDAPPAGKTLADIVPLAADRDLAILYTSSPTFGGDVKVAEALKEANPALTIGFAGPTVAVDPEASLLASPAIDFVAREEFDFTVSEVAEGRPLTGIDGLSYRDGAGHVVHNADREVLDFAFERADQLRVPLIVVHAFEMPMFDSWSSHDVEARRGRHQEDVEARLAPWRQAYPDVEVAPRCVPGPPRQALVDAARVAQLTVLGRHSGGHLRGTMLGSTARGFLHQTEHPVALVPVPAAENQEDVDDAGS